MSKALDRIALLFTPVLFSLPTPPLLIPNSFKSAAGERVGLGFYVLARVK